MKAAFALLLTVTTLLTQSQTKQDFLYRYFVSIPVADGFDTVRNFLDTCKAFSFDSVQKNRGAFYTHIGKDPFPDHFSRSPSMLVQHQRWQDSITKQHYDAASIVSVQYFFATDDKKGRDEFFKRLIREVSRYYRFSGDRWFSGKSKGQVRRFTKGPYNNFAELQVFKGFQDGFNYVTVRYDKRIHYHVKDPETFISVTSF